MNKFSVWISALRLRTLPLAAASIILAAGIAIHADIFNGVIFGLSLTTALLLQILSNLANDYGDAISGVDNKKRVGPKRAMQSGLITSSGMKKAIVITTTLCIFSGLSLLSVALGGDLYSWLLFGLLGVLSIVAAISYTMGKFSYGYRALGDISVFLFFGLLGVIGSYYLYGLSFNAALLLPAGSIGLLSAAVLNINNMRDMYTDREANKTTLVVMMGRKNAFIYHLFLVFGAPILSVCYLMTRENAEYWQSIILIILVPLIKNSLLLYRLIQHDERKGELFNEQLKNIALTTFSFSVLFSLMMVTAN